MRKTELIATIKVDAELSFLEKICDVLNDRFIVASQSLVKKNDRDDNSHVFLTLVNDRGVDEDEQ